MPLKCKNAAIALVLSTLAACAPVPPLPISSLQPGMDRQQVVAALGEPSDIRVESGMEVFFYQRPRSEAPRDLYAVLFVDGRVVAHKWVPPVSGSYSAPSAAPYFPAPAPQAPASTLPPRMIMCADGSYVYGSQCRMAPDGGFVGVP